MAKKLTTEEKKARLLAELQKIERAEAAEKMKDDPRMARIGTAIDRLLRMQHRASVTIKGRGRGSGAEARIAQLQAEIEDLQYRLDRDSQVELVIEEALAKAEEFRDGVLSGDIDPTERMPALPECLRTDSYRLTDAERHREAEAKIREEAQAARA